MKKVTAVPGLKVTYDNGMFIQQEGPAEAFWGNKDQIVHAHFKDWRL